MSRDPYRARAERLRQKIERVKPQSDLEPEQKKSLPKRSELHQEKRKKIKYPLIKGMLAFFVLLPILIFSIHSSLGSDGIGDAAEQNGKLEEVTYEIRQTEEKVKSGTSSQEEENSEPAAESESADSAIETRDSEESKSTVEKEQPAEEVDEESIVQLADQDEPSAETEFEQNVQVIDHVVQPKETLFRIAMNYYNSQAGIEKIKKWNNIENNDLEAGQILKIPLPVD